MAKHASKFSALQVVEPPRAMSVQVPLPMLDVLANAHNAFFDLCVDVGRQVFSALMEQDSEVLCGRKGLRVSCSLNSRRFTQDASAAS